MFYDYGTQKTYPPDSVFYLAKKYFDLPAQAIPCGLYNVRPYAGDRWKKSITDRFIDRINESLLAATVVSIDPSVRLSLKFVILSRFFHFRRQKSKTTKIYILSSQRYYKIELSVSTK